MDRLLDRVALITGGNTGIGRGVALAFAAEGADVAVAYHGHQAEAESVAREVEARGRRCLPVHVEVTREADVRAMVDAVRDRFGRIDIYVNNAGVQKPQPVADMTVDDWDHMMAVHLRGAFLCCRAVAPVMAAGGGGRIIVVTSQLGYIGRAGYTAYSAAKGGLLAFTRALAKELAPQGILVNSVSPGLIDNGFDPLPEAAKRAHAAALPLGRLGTVEDVVGAFVFLASDDGRYFCGQTLHPNGGEIMP
ncbi:MAG: 3-oxoacyl-ACP reductase FabG [Gemmataceae bacterium]|nr:3-oxoacyl-ACP reductase FabG [Gemmataceae bacterium]